MVETSSGAVDPEAIGDRVEFAAALTVLRERAGLTVRDLAKRASVPTATVSGYLSGRHLPNPTQPEALLAVLTACGATSTRAQEAWLATLRRVRQAPGRRSSSVPSPYPGLVSFQPEDAPHFFGRSELIAEIRTRIIDIELGRSEQRIVVITGPSGSGKSSALRAGVIPQMAKVGVQTVVMVPGEDPSADLAQAFADHSGLPVEDIAALFDGGGTLTALLARREPLLLAVDQAEEIFTACKDAARRATFLSVLQRLTDAVDGAGHRQIVVVLALRADFYAAAADEPVLLPALRHGQIVVGTMTRDELTEAIVGPAMSVGLHVEDALVQTLLEDLAPRDRPGNAHDRGALPLLAHALHATWQISRRGRMTVDDYLATGGIAAAVEHTAESVWADLDDESRELARRIFLRLVFVDDESMVTRRRVRLEELRGLGREEPDAAGLGTRAPTEDRVTVAGVVELFADARLLTLRTDTVEISHEALTGAWERLHQWIDADRSALRAHRQLSESARTWQRAGQDESYLLRSSRLAVVEDLLESGRVTLNNVEQRFVAASIRYRDERRATHRRQRTRLRIALAAVAVLALVTSALSVVALRSEASANARAAEASAARDDAQSRELAIAADRMRASDPALAAQLSLVAYRVAPTVDARSALLDTTALPLPTRIPSEEGPTFVAVDRAHAVMAVTNPVSGAVQLWSIASPHAPAHLVDIASKQPDVQQFSVAISPDGKQLAAGDAAGLVERWNISDPGHPSALPGPGVAFPSGVLALTFSPDGSQLAAGGEGEAVQRWTVADPEGAVALPKIPAGALVSALAWAPDGRTLWVGDGDGKVVGMPLSGGATGGAGAKASPVTPTTLDTGPRVVSALAVSPDGRMLTAGTKGGELHVWRRSAAGKWEPDSAGPAPLPGWLDTLAFSPDGSSLALGSTGNEIRVLAVRDLTEQMAMATPGPVTAIAYARDGTLAAGSSDGFTRLWPVPGPAIGPVGDIVVGVAMPTPHRLIVGPSSNVNALLSYDVTNRDRPQRFSAPPTPSDMRLAGVIAVSPDGKLTAMGSADGRVQLWNTADADRPVPIGAPFAGAPDFVDSMAISADGRVLAIGSDASVLDLWDITSPDAPSKLFESPDAGGQVTAVRFQPGGSLLAAATTGGNVRLWNAKDPAHPVPVANLTGLPGYVWTAAFSRDGAILAAGGSAREVRVWDVRDAAHIVPIGEPITGPANDIGALAFDPKGARLAAASYSGVVWMWDMDEPAKPQLRAKLRSAQGVLYSLAWSPDGTAFATGGSAQKVWTWTTHADAAAADICAVAGAGITKAEWKLYVQERSYTPPCS